ncbi:MAG: c-type cytochrome [Acidovorax sp.]|nr:c-type cytochrome [Acidovorax sp.]
MKTLRSLGWLTGLWLSCLGAAQAQTSDAARAPQGRLLAAQCAACHGTDGRAVAQSAVPGLAGAPAATLLAQLRAFRDGSQPATVMHQIAKGLTEPQMQSLAAYFAAQPR